MDQSLSKEFLLNALDDVFFVFDKTGTFIEWNQAANEVTGYSNEELQDMSPVDFFDAEDAKRIEGAITEVYESGISVIEADLLTNDGNQIPYEFKATKLPERGTDSPTFAGIGRDIRARREAQQDREALLDRMGDAFLGLDEEWHITYVNDEARQILAEAMGGSLITDDLLGLQLWDEIPEAVDTVFYEKYHLAVNTQKPVIFEEYYEPLETWFEVRAYPSESGLSIYFRDITEQREQRDALERRERVLRRIYDIMADRTKSFDEQVTALLSLGRQELALDYGTLSRIDGDDYIFEYVDAADESVQVGDLVPVSATNCELAASTERTLVLGDVARDAPEETDRAGYADWGISCYIGAPVFLNDEVYGTFCFYDTTPRRGQFTDWEETFVDLMSQWVSYELQRQHATEALEHQNEKLDQFAEVISHDLRNPLTVAKGRLELARDEFQSEDLETIQRALDRIETIIGDVLSLAKAGEDLGQMGEVDLATVIEGCWHTVDTGDASLEIDVNQVVEADETQLRQVFENLIRNAVEHGGEDVNITVGELDDGFYIEDDGPGIPEDERDDVFEAGYSTAEKGTGFGLSIVKQVAEAHGWDVRATDSPQGGARFDITGVEFAAE
jgi:PAS domain S-box-containing protein